MRRWLRIAWFLAALAGGLAAGLAYTWTVAPPRQRDISPQTLGGHDRVAYLALVGDLYAAEQDLERARRRLADLGLAADGAELPRLIEGYLDGGGDLETVRNLARLAQDLGASGGVLHVFGPRDVEATPTSRPATTPSPRPRPTLLPTAIALPEFRIAERTATCGTPGRPGSLVIRVRDARGNGLPGIEVAVSWAAGEDRFFTGLRPERGPGYADMELSPGVEYQVSLAGAQSESAQGIRVDLSPGICPTSSLGLDWLLTFQQLP